MEDGTPYIACRATTAIRFPGLGFCFRYMSVKVHYAPTVCQLATHCPQFDLSIITARDDQRQRRVECCPVDATIVSFQDVLYRNLADAESVCLGAGSIKGVVKGGGSCCAAGTSPILLDQTRYIPHTHRLIHGGRHNVVLCWMELCAHHVMAVACQDGNALSGLPVPNANGLVV